ncbi:MAG: GH36-type glycosyl hydrolase domain-containing protein, partial [bacterium]
RSMNEIQRDCPGRFFYIVDEEHQFAWSPNRVPMAGLLEDFTTTHEPGVTTIQSLFEDIETTINYFVPPDANHEIWYLTMENKGKKNRNLRVVSVCELLMGNTARDATDRQWDLLFKDVSYHDDDDVLVGTKRHWETQTDNEREIKQWPYAVFKTATKEPSSWEASRSSFFGTYRSYHNPAALEYGRLGQNEVHGEDAVGALDWKITLPGGETENFASVVGVVPREEVDTRDWAEIQEDDYPETALKRTRRHWRERTSDVQVSLPAEDMEHIVNTWLPAQVSINTWFGRSPSFWHSSQGYTGFRDACHESFGISPLDQEAARDKIKHILSFTFENGLNSHRTPRGARDYDRSDNADDPLWVPLALSSYLRETGDWEFLEEEVGYLESDKTASVVRHMIEGLDYVLTQRGERGLPLIRYGDWNDALDTLGQEGEGESVWIGQFLHGSLKMAIEILERIEGYEEKIDQYRDAAAELKEVINEKCWDGQWYLRAFADDGREIGSAENEYGQLFLNTQTWAVLCDVAAEDRANKAFDAVKEKLDTRWGYRYFAPAYDEIDPEIGVITQFIPGKKENGSIFSHAAAFSIIALAKLGRNREAFELLRKLSPTNHAREHPDHYRLEPYVFCQNVTGPDSPDFGEGNYHWLSGTASWIYRGVVDHLLGVRPDWEGMRIDPSLPPHWDEAEIKRVHRGTTWKVKIFQEDDPAGEIDKIIVDGEEIKSNLVEYPENKSNIKVEVFVK